MATVNTEFAVTVPVAADYSSTGQYLFGTINTSGQFVVASSQGQMAVDMMVRILNGEKPGKDFPFRAGPIIPTIVKGNMADYPYELLFGPKTFRPEFKVEPKK